MSAQNVTVVGMQWGDEGKGKVVDALAAACRFVVRFCGGANAGHTVVAGGQKFAFHLIPCGILHPGTANVLGNGVAFDPDVFLQELDQLTERRVPWGPANMLVSHAANVVMSYHKDEDKLGEAALGAGKIGTTARGIGPCYADKARRSTAIRVADLVNPDELAGKVRQIVAIKNKTFAALYDAPAMDADAIVDRYAAMGKRIAPLVANTGYVLRKALADGQRILFEGGQGSMLDIDHGTYPYVTSSSVSACGVSAGAGVPPSAVGQVVGLTKAYTSRVGSGPFPTEQDNEIGSRLRERGHEYGTTTGRPRRCGWFDAFAVRYAADLSGANELTLSLLDVLSGFEQIKICTGYRRGGATLEAFDATAMGGVECVYETMPGWKEEIGGCKTFGELPRGARDYVARLEQLLGRPVGFISVGPGREQTISHHTKVEGLSR